MSRLHKLRDAFRRHERAVLTAYAAGFGALLFVVGFAPLRVPLLDRVEAAWLRWDDRWTERVEHGEALVKAGRFQDAATYLAKLDSLFPARVVKHKRDAERTRVLMALGKSYVELGKKRSALDAYARLVAFDERNWRSHYAMAEAATTFNEPDLAVAEYSTVLKIHPNHLPSVRALVDRKVWESDFDAVVSIYEAYLNAYQLLPVQLHVGRTAIEIDAPADGQFHEVEVVVPPEAKGADTLRVSVGGFYAEVARVELQGPVLIGRAGMTTTSVAPSAGGAWRISERIGVEPSAAEAAEARIALPAMRDGVERMRISLRIPKPVDSGLWTVVAQAYRNRLRLDDLKTAHERSYILRSPEAADLLPVRE